MFSTTGKLDVSKLYKPLANVQRVELKEEISAVIGKNIEEFMELTKSVNNFL